MLIQPELRHILGDLGYVFAEVVDKTAGESLEDARDRLGQIKSSTGTFQNVAQKALAQARAAKAATNTTQNGDSIERLTAAASLSEANTQPNGQPNISPPSIERNVELPNLALLREQLSLAFKDGNLNFDTIRQELVNGNTIPALEELRKQALTSAATLSKSQDDLQRMREQIKQGQIPAEVMEALQQKQDIENGDASANAPLTVTDIVDAAQMLAIANSQTHLKPSSETVKQMVNKTRKDAEANLKAAFNEDVQERLLARTKKLIVDCQSTQEYKDALVWFIERIEAFFSLIQRHAELPSSSLDEALSYNAEPLLQLLENFNGKESIRPVLEAAKVLSNGAKEDPHIRAFWTDADAHLKRCLLEEGYILTPEADEGLRKLIQRFKNFAVSYREKISSFIEGIASFFNSIRKDALTIKLLSALKAIFDAVRKDGWKPGALWHDLRHKILPPLFEKFGVIPVPRIKYLHPDFDLVIENIALELSTLLPDTLDMRLTNDVHFDFRQLKDSNHSHSLKIKIKGMSLRVYKLAFAVTSRLGFTFHDKGIADLLIKNFGLSIYIDVPKNPGPHYFTVRKVKAKLGSLHLKVYESNHRILHFMADKLANSYLTKRILRHFIAEGITLGLKQLDVYLMTLRLDRDGKKGDVKLEDIKRQMAELRDLLKKYHEQAGTIEIDFTREDNLTGMTISDRAKAAGKSIENSHAVKWVKKQVDETGRKEIIRNEWRSNAFDLDGMNTIKAPFIQPTEETKQETDNIAAPVDGEVHESVEAAIIRGKPEGPTDERVVDKAEKELSQAKAEERSDREEVQNPEGMSSKIGKKIVSQSDDRSKQAEQLENAVENHTNSSL